VELLFPSVICAGFLMFGVWIFNLDRFASMLPLPVMLGFCNGLAYVIGSAQLHAYHAPLCSSAAVNSTAPLNYHHERCTDSGWKEGPELLFMLLQTFASMVIMECFPKIPRPARPQGQLAWLRPLHSVATVVLKLPSSMLAIVASVALEILVVRPLGHATPTIADLNEFTRADALPRPFFLNTDEYTLSRITLDTVPTILWQGAMLCAVGTVESLMTAEVVSEKTKSTHDSGMVVAAMGAGNIISGLLGGMGGNAMIGLSTIAVLNGGRSCIGPIVTALVLFLCVAVAYPLLNFIPIASLVGVMAVVVLHTFQWYFVPVIVASCMPSRARHHIARLLARTSRWRGQQSAGTTMNRKIDGSDVLITVAVTCTVAVSNLVYGVGLGLILSCLIFAWRSSLHLKISSRVDEETGAKVYAVAGPLFFASSKRFVKAFDADNDPSRVEVLFSHGELFDYSALDAIACVSRQYATQQKRINFRQLTTSSMKKLQDGSHLVPELRPAGAKPGDNRLGRRGGFTLEEEYEEIRVVREEPAALPWQGAGLVIDGRSAPSLMLSHAMPVSMAATVLVVE
jgi:SulP family sulfate permease